jgi:hypothetical protein
MMSEQNINRRIYHFILQTFSRTGKPPSVLAIAAEFKIPELTVVDGYLTAIEVEGGIYRDSITGNILSAYPFSATPTNHRVFFGENRQVFAMCAIDALGIPFMLDTDATINSTCSQCGKVLSVGIANGQITTNSDELVVIYTTPRAECCAATELCPYINFFCSTTHAKDWQDSQPHLETKTLTLPEALELAKVVFGNLFNENAASIWVGLNGKESKKT